MPRVACVPQAPRHRRRGQTVRAAVRRQRVQERVRRRVVALARRAEHARRRGEQHERAAGPGARSARAGATPRRAFGASTPSMRSGVSEPSDAVVEHARRVDHRRSAGAPRGPLPAARAAARARLTSHAAIVTSRPARPAPLAARPRPRPRGPGGSPAAGCRTPVLRHQVARQQRAQLARAAGDQDRAARVQDAAAGVEDRAIGVQDAAAGWSAGGSRNTFLPTCRAWLTWRNASGA